jgi:hypothetical protein
MFNAVPPGAAVVDGEFIDARADPVQLRKVYAALGAATKDIAAVTGAHPSDVIVTRPPAESV